LTPISGVVLVGGGSVRMGKPKQLLLRHEVTLGDLAVNSLAAHLDEVVLAGSGPVPEALLERTMLDDVQAAKGPLAGILAAMRYRPERAWLVAACDMPSISAEAVAWLLEQRRAEAWAVLPRVASQLVEPLLAVYEPSILPLLEERAAAGWWGFQPLRAFDRVLCPEIPPGLAKDWVNVNTPEQIQDSPGLDV
jgi:molybdopterin-guanine dinucleotide biosynthesis protein A